MVNIIFPMLLIQTNKQVSEYAWKNLAQLGQIQSKRVFYDRVVHERRDFVKIPVLYGFKEGVFYNDEDVFVTAPMISPLRMHYKKLFYTEIKTKIWI
ncbi:hypothetical protein DMB92_09100 [Campylobacter sp. MIT 99-7217]|uniref:hypothetical protein n=1 Tax=Campylobacter sp. MIT 99-7217 TaxID=535091 RepID=UPI001158F4B3|nr:hypothetical protein [Campylobacter sp. MIT 99-7217]TQR28641.1 hypothetical protein DMB92_09100 [Campylobacter sp. MIT 99-7217]